MICIKFLLLYNHNQCDVTATLSYNLMSAQFGNGIEFKSRDTIISFFNFNIFRVI